MITVSRSSLGAKSGLTLMELLISLALLAVITAGVMSSMALALRIYDRSDAYLPQSEPVAYRLHLRRWLAAAAPPSLLAPFPIKFEGNDNGFSFTTLAETAFFPEAAAMEVTVGVRDETLNLTLITLQDDGTPLQSFEQVLARDAADVRFGYLAAGAAVGEWQPIWAQVETLPLAVSIQVDPGSVPEWPEFIVQLAFAQ